MSGQMRIGVVGASVLVGVGQFTFCSEFEARTRRAYQEASSCSLKCLYLLVWEVLGTSFGLGVSFRRCRFRSGCEGDSDTYETPGRPLVISRCTYCYYIDNPMT